MCSHTQGASCTALALLLPAAIIRLLLVCLHPPLNLFCSSIEGVVKDKKEEGEVHAQIKGKDIKKNADPENPGYFVEQTKSELPACELARPHGLWRPARRASTTSGSPLPPSPAAYTAPNHE